MVSVGDVVFPLVNCFVESEFTLMEMCKFRCVSKLFESNINSVLHRYTLPLNSHNFDVLTEDFIGRFESLRIFDIGYCYNYIKDVLKDKFKNKTKYTFTTSNMGCNFYSHFSGGKNYIFIKCSLIDECLKALNGAENYTFMNCEKLSPECLRYIRGAKKYYFEFDAVRSFVTGMNIKYIAGAEHYFFEGVHFEIDWMDRIGGAKKYGFVNCKIYDKHLQYISGAKEYGFENCKYITNDGLKYIANADKYIFNNVRKVDNYTNLGNIGSLSICIERTADVIALPPTAKQIKLVTTFGDDKFSKYMNLEKNRYNATANNKTFDQYTSYDIDLINCIGFRYPIVYTLKY